MTSYDKRWFEIRERLRPEWVEPIHPLLSLAYIGAPPENEGEAWDMTMDKWTILEKETGRDVLLDDGVSRTCGLCVYFECPVCPISLAGHMGCENTPFYDYRMAVENNDVVAANEAAKDELEFLAMTREEGEVTDE